MKASLRWTAVLLIPILAALACQSTSVPGQTSSTVLFQDDFSDPASGWLQGQDETGLAEYRNGGFRIYVGAETSGKLSIVHGMPFTDTRIEVDATKVGGPDDNDFGIICRYVDENNFYFFEISSDGYSGIGKYRNNELTLIGGGQMQASEAVHQGDASNHLRADCVGTTLTLHVNGVQVAEVTDSDFNSGSVGLIAGTFETPGTDIFFDNFTVMKP